MGAATEPTLTTIENPEDGYALSRNQYINDEIAPDSIKRFSYTASETTSVMVTLDQNTVDADDVYLSLESTEYSEMNTIFVLDVDQGETIDFFLTPNDTDEPETYGFKFVDLNRASIELSDNEYLTKITYAYSESENGCEYETDTEYQVINFKEKYARDHFNSERYNLTYNGSNSLKLTNSYDDDYDDEIVEVTISRTYNINPNTGEISGTHEITENLDSETCVSNGTLTGNIII